jgi:hypothetical protein
MTSIPQPSGRRTNVSIDKYRGAMAALLAASLLTHGCGPEGKNTCPQVWLARPEVVRPATPPAESIAADIYIDATLSMTGYVADPDSAYIHLLDELEGSLANKGKGPAKLSYFKFGKSVREVPRDQFRAARKRPFYLEKGIFETTDIDLVASRANPKRLTVVVTDLFQGDQDINPIVGSLRDHVFGKGLSAGILAIGSEFDGKVYDARVPPFHYASTRGTPASYRPFYLLMFGDAGAIEQLVAALAEGPLVNRSRFLLIAPNVVRRYQICAVKQRASRDLKTRAITGEADEFAFDLRDGARGGLVDVSITLDPDPNAPDLRTESIAIAVRRTLPVAGDTGEIALQGVTRTGNVLKAQLLLDLAGPQGKYGYDVLFRTGGAGGWSAPKWIDELSSDNPTPTQQPNRTMNLKRLVTELIDASASIHRPALAKLTLNVRKLG